MVETLQMERAQSDSKQKEEAMRKLEEEVKVLEGGNKMKDQFSATLCEKVSKHFSRGPPGVCNRRDRHFKRIALKCISHKGIFGRCLLQATKIL